MGTLVPQRRLIVKSPVATDTFKSVSQAASPPGTVVADFNALLAHLGRAGGVPLSPKNDEFGMAELATLNALCARPLRTGLARPRQGSLANLDGLNMLLRATRLARIEERKSGRRLMIDVAALDAWTKLNPFEQYFALMKAWFDFSATEDSGGGVAFGVKLLDCLEFINQIPPRKGLEVGSSQDRYFSLRYRPGLKHLALLDMFGLIDVSSGAPVPGKAWLIEIIHATPWGQSLAIYTPIIRNDLTALLMESHDTASGISMFGPLSKVLRPAFPQWRNELMVKAPAKAGNVGAIVFKVSWGKVWRRLEVPARHSFADLASDILKSYGFDSDHLYRFSFKDVYGAMRCIDDERLADEMGTVCGYDVALGEAGLSEGSAIKFHYDFGDDWKFALRVEEVDPSRRIKVARCIAEHGPAPAQYGLNEDED